MSSQAIFRYKITVNTYLQNLFFILFLLSCAASPVNNVKLFSDNEGFDVRCSESLGECRSFAHNLCKGKYRVHNVTEFEGLSMRFECVETAQAVKECQLKGVSCIL